MTWANSLQHNYFMRCSDDVTSDDVSINQPTNCLKIDASNCHLGAMISAGGCVGAQDCKTFSSYSTKSTRTSHQQTNVLVSNANIIHSGMGQYNHYEKNTGAYYTSVVLPGQCSIEHKQHVLSSKSHKTNQHRCSLASLNRTNNHCNCSNGELSKEKQKHRYCYLNAEQLTFMPCTICNSVSLSASQNSSCSLHSGSHLLRQSCKQLEYLSVVEKNTCSVQNPIICSSFNGHKIATTKISVVPTQMVTGCCGTSSDQASLKGMGRNTLNSIVLNGKHDAPSVMVPDSEKEVETSDTNWHLDDSDNAECLLNR